MKHRVRGFCCAGLVYVVDWLSELVFIFVMEMWQCIDVGVRLVLVFVGVVFPSVRMRLTTDCRQPNVRVHGQTPVPTLPLGSPLKS
jgi:hypothetical protein